MDIEGDIILRDMEEADCEKIKEAFAPESYGATTQLYTSYFEASRLKEGSAIVACLEGKIVGYAVIRWQSQYEHFEEQAIPEIKVVHVLKAYRNKGIATRLMDELEYRAKKHSAYCSVGVGLAEDFEDAQKLYEKRGYKPDGNGIFYIDESVYSQIEVDDNQGLMLVKDL